MKPKEILKEIKSLSESEMQELFLDFLKVYNKSRIYPVTPELIVCAAVRIYNSVSDKEAKNPEVILCTRHGDPFYHNIHDLYEELTDKEWLQLDQGFVTNKGRYVLREEALEIALRNNQIVRLSSSFVPRELFSEDLY